MCLLRALAARYAFAEKYCSKIKAWWNSHIHGFIDGKHFQVPERGIPCASCTARHLWGIPFTG